MGRKGKTDVCGEEMEAVGRLLYIHIQLHGWEINGSWCAVHLLNSIS